MLKGEVIWNHPRERIKMPKDFNNGNSNWRKGYKYIIEHPISCLKLASYRIGKMFIQIREHHSLKYKIHILIWIIPAYFLALIGIIKYFRSSAIILVLSVLFGHSIIVGLTYATHESRFIIYLLPIIYFLSACGLSTLIQKNLRHLKYTNLYK